MKIEMGESICYSYLRHVQKCWVVQTNWKVSEYWEKCLSDDELETIFQSMRQTFDPDGSVFKKTKDCAQFLRQAEIDIVGVGQNGSIHAIDVAFHERGLNYSGRVGDRVLKKLLRTLLVLRAYHPCEVSKSIYFISPKVNPASLQPLQDILSRLRDAFQAEDWHLYTNDTFSDQVLYPTLRATSKVADTSELFLRSVKLLEVGGLAGFWSEDKLGDPEPGIHRVPEIHDVVADQPIAAAPQPRRRNRLKGRLQILVDSLMLALLEDFPGLLTNQEQLNLLDRDYCQRTLGLKLAGFPLLRRMEDGKSINGHDRYWAEPYGCKYYVTSQWWKDDHAHNTASLLRWIEELIVQNAGHPGGPDLEQHRAALREFLANLGGS